jgi:surface antigen
MNRKIIAAMIVAASLPIAGCETMDGVSKEKFGAATGAIAGALIGKKVGGENEQLGTALGAVAGAYIGQTIGRMLDEQDRQRLAQSTYNTLQTGQPQSWHNPETGVRATTTVKQSTTQQQQVQVKVLKDKVKTVPPMEFVGEEYSANKNVNVRGGPGTDYVVVDKLTAGEHINVVGKVAGKPWYMISRGGVGSGFVYTSLLATVPVENWTVAQSEAPVATTNVQTAAVNATRDCRVVSQEVTLGNGQTATEDVTACRGPNGWEIV